ncbi:MAG: hypothetical protein ACFFA4_04630 [Promethearchaeota archaeon]
MTVRNWNTLKWGKNGRSKRETIANTAVILKNILNNGLKEKLNLKDYQAPTKRQLEQNGYKTYLNGT